MALVALVLAVAATCAACEAASTHLVFDGQSYNLVPGPSTSFPSKVMAARPDADTSTVVALNDTSWTNLAATADTRSLPSGGLDVLVMSGGFSDLVEEGDTAEKLLADEVAYAQTARARGFDYVVITTIPPSTVIYNHGQEAQRVEHNHLLVEQASGAFDGVVDIEVACIDNPTSDCYLDGTHWSGEGTTIVANLVGPVIDSVLGKPSLLELVL